ncbi:hypothetical protein DL96DRAFT_481693 [Flagelloscypha sp. PMI_526]|nr:hypothetical protein DL96DRAFT_481693 [Flagelloscypha sp. PMI_526]
MAQCQTNPTATQTNLRTEQQTFTTSSASIVTISQTKSGAITTQTTCPTALTTCLLDTGHGVTVIPSSTRTDQVPLTITTSIVLTDFQTLFGTTCSDAEPPVVTTTSTSTTSSTPSTNPPGTTTISLTAASFSSSASSVSATLVPAPSGSNIPMTAIIGGAIGGVAILVILAVLIPFLMRRKNKWDDNWDGDYFEPMNMRPVGGSAAVGRESLGLLRDNGSEQVLPTRNEMISRAAAASTMDHERVDSVGNLGHERWRSVGVRAQVYPYRPQQPWFEVGHAQHMSPPPSAPPVLFTPYEARQPLRQQLYTPSPTPGQIINRSSTKNSHPSSIMPPAYTLDNGLSHNAVPESSGSLSLVGSARVKPQVPQTDGKRDITPISPDRKRLTMVLTTDQLGRYGR